VHANIQNKLASCDAIVLKENSNRDAFDRNAKLDPSVNIGEELGNVDDELNVVVPSHALVERQYKKQRYDGVHVDVFYMPQIDITGKYVYLPRPLLKNGWVGPQNDV
jgi:hypothetical protein